MTAMSKVVELAQPAEVDPLTDQDRVVAADLCGVLMVAVGMHRPRVLPDWQVRAWKATYQRAVEMHENSPAVRSQREQLEAALDSLQAVRQLVETGQPFISFADLLVALDGGDR